MTLSDFVLDDWKRIFKNIKLVRFVTKIDVMDGDNKIAELENNHKVRYVLYETMYQKYGKAIVDDVARLNGDIGKEYDVSEISYIVCDDLELIKSNLATMAQSLYEIGLVDDRQYAYGTLYKKYKKFGYKFEFLGYDFEIVTENDIKNKLNY